MAGRARSAWQPVSIGALLCVILIRARTVGRLTREVCSLANDSKNQATGASAPRPRNRTVRAFIEGLGQLEKERNSSALVELFADGCSVANVQLEQPLTGTQGAKRFWHDYRETFSEVESSFSRIIESGSVVVLEWTSRGKLRIGRPIEYRGVSILTLEGGKIARFVAYYDSAPFIAHL
jgi:ketosteroid isomerase-like protein